MALTKAEIESQVDNYFEGQYDVINGTTIPNVDDVPLGKTGKEMELAMLFIDIRESTKIVDGFRRVTAAKMYKSFLWGVARIARLNGGELRSFNGDGVLVAFNGDLKATHAAKAALQMSWFCKKVLKPRLQAYFENNNELSDLEFGFAIGIDVGKVLVVRGGIRGENNNDLIWVGNATNYAVKLSSISNPSYNVFISETCFTRLNDSSKYDGDPKRSMWTKLDWNGKKVYGSGWTWPI